MTEYNELRYNPILNEWIIYAPKRQKRPDRDITKCPFCEGSEEIPVFNGPVRIKNKFPALDKKFSTYKEEKALWKIKKGAYGTCEVLVYSAKHDLRFSELEKCEVNVILKEFVNATKEFSKDKKIKYILPFENYGKDVGASIIHPHGQIYGFSFIPQIIQNEIKLSKKYYKKHKTCLTCAIIDNELNDKKRIVYENEQLIVFIPYYAQYAYDLYVYPKRCYGYLGESSKEELEAFSIILPKIVKALTIMFGQEVSYSLSLHQAPLNYRGAIPYHMYFKLHTPQRNPNSLKILGAVETSLGVFINGTLPETAAKQYAEALSKVSD